MKSPVKLLKALLTDVRNAGYDAKQLERDFHTLERRFEYEGLSFLCLTLPSLGDALLSGLASGSFVCPTSFRKIRRGAALPALFQGLLTKIFDSDTGTILDRPDIDCVEFLHTICRTFKKLEVESSRADLLERAAISKYLDNEESIPEDICPRRLDIIKNVSQIVLSNFMFDETMLTGRHGPGAVREGLKPNEKWFWTWCGSYTHPLLSRLYHNESISLWERPPNLALTSPSAKVVAVPKNYTSVRLITIEPYANQFVQGGLRMELLSLIKSSPLAKCIALDRQDLSQKEALEGSLTGSKSTLDLSSASDLLSLNLVKEIFSTQPVLWGWIEKCRTPYAEFGKLRILHKKFAGMGNATTFPIQSIVFSILCIAALIDEEDRKPSYKNVCSAASRIRVYGDDIIVPTSSVASVIEWLQGVGLKVNTSKSFFNGSFREACGCDAFMGVDITPTYVRKWPRSDSTLAANELASLIATSNIYYSKGYWETARFIRNMLEEIFGSIPHVSQRSESLGWYSYCDRRTIQKWNPRLHRFEFRGVVIRTKKSHDILDGYPALLKFFHKEENVDYFINDRHLSLEKTARRYSVSISRRWCSY